MYEELVKRLRSHNGWALNKTLDEAADAIEELQTTLCNWCAVCPEDKRDLSTCEIYESCRARPPKEEKTYTVKSGEGIVVGKSAVRYDVTSIDACQYRTPTKEEI